MHGMKATRTLAGVAVSALALGPAAYAGSPPSPVKKSATYKGMTKQGNDCYVEPNFNQPCAVTVKTNSDRNRASIVIGFVAPCSNGENTYRGTTKVSKMAVSSKAGFSAKGAYKEPLADGSSADNKVAVAGTFSRSSTGKYKVKGTFSVQTKLTLPGKPTTDCSSATVKWSAKPS
jgi:hypothetical protein